MLIHTIPAHSHEPIARALAVAVAMIVALAVPAWDPRVSAATTVQPMTFTGLGHPVTARFSPNGRFLVAGDLHGVVMRDGRSLRIERTFSSSEGAGPLVAFSRNGRLMATGSPSGKILVFEVSSRRVVASLGPIARTYADRQLDEHTWAIAEIDALAMSSDGSLIAAAENIGEVWGSKYYTWSSTAVHVWNARTGRQIALLRGHERRGHPAKILSVTFNPRGDILATGGEDGTARLWLARTGQRIATLNHSGRTPHSLVFTPDGRRFITATLKHIRVWDLRSWRPAIRVSARSGLESLHSLALDPSGRFVAVGQSDNLIRIWSIETGRLLRTMGQRRQWRWVVSVAFSPDGQLLVTAASEGGSDAEMELWTVLLR